jgi:hypothetical protein
MTWQRKVLKTHRLLGGGEEEKQTTTTTTTSDGNPKH